MFCTVFGFGCFVGLVFFWQIKELCGAVDMLEERNIIQRDLHSIEREPYVNFMRFCKAKFKIFSLVTKMSGPEGTA